MSLPVIIRGNEGEQYSTYTTAQFPIGSKLELGPDGRTFRFALAGAVAIVAGQLIQGKVGDDQIIDMDVEADAAVASKTFTTTNGTTVLTEDELAGGYVVLYEVATPSTLGHSYRIFGNSAAANGGVLTFTLDPNSVGLIRAITASATDVDASWNPYSGVVVSSGIAPTGAPAGVAVQDIPIANYGWLQTKGLVGVLVDDGGALDQGDSIVPGTDVGSVVIGAGTSIVAPLGFANTNTAADEYGIVTLQID